MNECPVCFLPDGHHLANCSTLGMTLRELWDENHRRRAAGLPAVDRKGVVRVRKEPTPVNPEDMLDVAGYLSYYDPKSPKYRPYHGD